MLKVFSKKTNFVLMGIIIGFSIGMSIHQAFGDTTSVPGTLQGDSLTVNMDGQYTNGLIVANGNMLVPNGRVGVHITNGGFADLHVDGTTYITGKTVMGTGSHLPENSSSMLTVEGVMFITGGNGIGSTKGVVSKGSSCAMKAGGTCDANKQELCIGSVCMNEAQLKAKLQVATLSVIKAGTGEGTVISDPIGINCGSECIHNFSKSTSVKLTATPIAGSLFTGWTGACSGTGTTCTVALAEDKNVIATFTPDGPSPYNLTVTKAGTGTGTVTSVPTGTTFASGTAVTLTASPATGSTFTGWTGACTNTTGTCTVTMTGDKSVTATFSSSAIAITTEEILPVGTVGSAYSVTLTANQTGGTWTKGTGGSLPDGLTLNSTTGVIGTSISSASFHGDFTFSVVYTISGQTSVTKNFKMPVNSAGRYALIVNKTGTGSGKLGVNGAPGYMLPLSMGDRTGTIILEATADAGSTFAGWSGACTNATGTCTVTMDSNKTVTATFTAGDGKVNPDSPITITSPNGDVYKSGDVMHIRWTGATGVIRLSVMREAVPGGYNSTFGQTSIPVTQNSYDLTIPNVSEGIPESSQYRVMMYVDDNSDWQYSNHFTIQASY